MDDLQGMAGLAIAFVCGLIPIVVAILCSAVWWSKLARPGFFLLMAILALSGIKALLDAALNAVRMLSYIAGKRWFENNDLSFYLLQDLALNATSCVFTVVLGALLLRAAMRRQLTAAAK